MRLGEGSYAVPSGHLAVVVTHLICHAPANGRAASLPAGAAAGPEPVGEGPDGVSLRLENSISPDTYRRLFRMVGRDWLWTSRLMLADDALVSTLLDPAVALYTVRSHGGTLGMVELDLGRSGVPKIAFFGLTPEASGRGIGRWLMEHFQAMLFAGGAEAIRLDTCTLDSPHALRFYLRTGFVAERREVRVFPDPRALGLLEPDAAPFTPRL